MSRTNQKLINYHTSGETMPLVTDVNFGEIVVRHNEKNQELLIKVNSGGTETFVAFGSKAWVNEQIKNAKDALEENLNQSIANVSGAVWSISADIKTYIDQMDTSLQGQINSTNRELGYVSSSTVGLSGVVESFSGVVYRDYATKAYVNGKVEDIDSDISELNTKVNNFSSATWNAFSGIYDTYATSANVHSTIDSLNTQVGYLSGATSALSAVVATFSAATEATFVDKSTYSAYTATTNTSITNLQNNLNKLSGVTSALSANVITALDDIKSSITADLSSVYKYKGTKDTYAELPASNNEVGDVWNVVEAVGEPGQPGYTPAGTNYAWVGANGDDPTAEGYVAGHWDALGGTVDLSNYATTAITNGLDTRLQSVETGLTALSGATSALSASVIANYATRSEVSAETSAVNTQLGYLSSSTVALSGVVATFSAATENTFVDKTTYTTYTGNVNTSITNLQTGLGNLSGATSALSASVVNNYATKAEVSAETSAVMTEVGYLSSSTVSLSGVVKTLSGVVYTNYARKSELKTVSDKLDGLDTDVRQNLSASTVALSGVVGTIQQTAGNAITGVKFDAVSATTSDTGTTYASGAKVNSTKGQNAIIDLSSLIIDCGTF